MADLVGKIVEDVGLTGTVASQDVLRGIVMLSGTASSGSGGVQTVDVLPENPEDNMLYLYNSELLGRVIMSWQNQAWHYMPLMPYPQRVFVNPIVIYDIGSVYGSTPLGAISLVDVPATPVGEIVATSAVKIYGWLRNGINYGWTFNITVPEGVVSRAYFYLGMSAEGTFDVGHINVNGVNVGTTYGTGSNPPTAYAVPITLQNGDNSFVIRYTKDGSTNRNDDAVYIYGVGYYLT